METNPIDAWINLETRRQLFGRTAKGLGAAALASLLNHSANDANAGEVIGGAGEAVFLGRGTSRRRRNA